MKKIDTMSSFSGRLLIQEIYQEMRYEKQRSSLSCLLDCWKICTHEKDINKYVDIKATILHPLGIWRGTGLWMEEVVNRFYFTTINSFVYFGAAILLVLIGLRRFSEKLDDNMVIAGIIFEALLLVFMFIVMLFTPNEEINLDKSNKENESDELKDELLTEIGEISRDFAASVVNLEVISEKLEKVSKNQSLLLEKFSEISGNLANAVSPNPEMINAMKDTNSTLKEFTITVQMLNESAKKIHREEIENSVRKELEKIISEKLSK